MVSWCEDFYFSHLSILSGLFSRHEKPNKLHSTHKHSEAFIFLCLCVAFFFLIWDFVVVFSQSNLTLKIIQWCLSCQFPCDFQLPVTKDFLKKITNEGDPRNIQ